MVLGLVWPIACGSPAPSAAPAPEAIPAAAPGAPATAPALTLQVSPAPVQGLCEPSGAARAADGSIWVVDDDQPDRVFAWQPGAPAATPHLLQAPGGLDLKDPEGLSVADDGALWIVGSHSRSRKGKVGDRAAVVRGVPADGAVQVTHQTDGLRPGKDPHELQPLLDGVARVCPGCALSAGDLDVEGAAWDDGRLLLGLRAPLAGRHAVVVATRADDTLRGLPADRVVEAAWTLDLGGRGVRDLARRPGGDWLVLAGDTGDGPAAPALYAWTPGADPVLLGELTTALGGTPEAVVPVGADAAWLLVDEGARLKAALAPGGPHAHGPADDLKLRCGHQAPAAGDHWAHALRVGWSVALP